MKHWYVVECKTGQEDRATENLLRLMYETYYPMIQQEVMRRGQVVITRAPLFPNYVFVRFDHSEQSASVINNTFGVRKLITFGDVLVPLADDLINRIKGKKDFVRPLPKPKVLAQGDAFKIEGGCFEGLDAVFDEPLGANRSWILIQILGGQQRVMVDNRYIA